MNLTTEQMMARLLKRAELLKSEFTGYFLGKRKVISEKEIQSEIKRREMMDSRWRWKD